MTKDFLKYIQINLNFLPPGQAIKMNKFKQYFTNQIT